MNISSNACEYVDKSLISGLHRVNDEDIEEFIKSSFVLDVDQITLPLFSSSLLRPKSFEPLSFFQQRHIESLSGSNKDYFKRVVFDAPKCFGLFAPIEVIVFSLVDDAKKMMESLVKASRLRNKKGIQYIKEKNAIEAKVDFFCKNLIRFTTFCIIKSALSLEEFSIDPLKSYANKGFLVCKLSGNFETMPPVVTGKILKFFLSEFAQFLKENKALLKSPSFALQLGMIDQFLDNIDSVSGILDNENFTELFFKTSIEQYSEYTPKVAGLDFFKQSTEVFKHILSLTDLWTSDEPFRGQAVEFFGVLEKFLNKEIAEELFFFKFLKFLKELEYSATLKRNPSDSFSETIKNMTSGCFKTTILRFLDAILGSEGAVKGHGLFPRLIWLRGVEDPYFDNLKFLACLLWMKVGIEAILKLRQESFDVIFDKKMQLPQAFVQELVSLLDSIHLIQLSNQELESIINWDSKVFKETHSLGSIKKIEALEFVEHLMKKLPKGIDEAKVKKVLELADKKIFEFLTQSFCFYDSVALQEELRFILREALFRLSLEFVFLKCFKELTLSIVIKSSEIFPEALIKLLFFELPKEAESRQIQESKLPFEDLDPLLSIDIADGAQEASLCDELSHLALSSPTQEFLRVIKEDAEESLALWVLDAEKIEKDAKDGRDVMKILARNGFHEYRRRGSHMIYKSATGAIVVVPFHKSLKMGTKHSIARQFMKAFAKPL